MITLSFDIDRMQLTKISEMLSKLGIKKFVVTEKNDSELEFSVEQQTILEERLKLHHLNPTEGKTLEEARDSINQKYGL